MYTDGFILFSEKYAFPLKWTSLVTQTMKNLPAMWET